MQMKNCQKTNNMETDDFGRMTIGDWQQHIFFSYAQYTCVLK